MSKKTLEIIDKIDDIYPDPKCELVYNSTYELLVAVILSAQCTDKLVNTVTQKLFKEYNTPEKMITLTQAQLERKIKSCGFYRNKAKYILEASNDIVTKHGGQVPSNKLVLMQLAGVGEKTANVILATAFNFPAIAVDTHVFRVSNRLGIAHSHRVETVQKQLEKNISEDKWINVHHALVLHGRYVCKAINPKCDKCELSALCKYYNTEDKSQFNTITE